MGLNNLFLVFLFTGSVRLIPYLSINKTAVFQPPYSTTLLIEDLWPNYIASSLHFIILFCNLIFLFNFPSICGLIPLYKLIFKIIWSPGFISRCSRYTFIYFLSLVNASIPYFLSLVNASIPYFLP